MGKEKPKALITAPFSKAGLERIGEWFEVEYTGWGVSGKLMPKEDILERIEDTELFVTEMERADEEVIRRGKKLKLIASPRGNPHNIDTEVAAHYGIPVLFGPGRNAIAVTEVTFGLMIDLLRYVSRSNRYVAEGNWTPEGEMSYVKFRGRELHGRILGLIGLGEIGRRVASIARAFGMSCMAFDPYVGEEKARELEVELGDLSTVCSRSDVVSVHCKVTPETTGMMNMDRFEEMKSDAIFLNTARSAVTVEKDLATALDERKIAGAAIDVFDKEPLPKEHPFFKLDNILLTPHIGGASHEVVDHHSEMIAEDVERYMQNERPHRVFTGKGN